MKFLYGDSTPSSLQSNYLFFLRDAMEFCVHLLLSQQRIDKLREELRGVEKHAEGERARIAGLHMLVVDAAEAANTDGPGSMSKLAVDRIVDVCGKAIATTSTELEAKLAANRATIAAKDREERDGCLDAFGKYIALHQAHEGAWRLSARLDDNGQYAGETSGDAPYGAAWRCALELQGTHPMSKPIRVGDLIGQIEISLPEGSGWQKKNPKRRPQRIDAFSIDEVSSDGASCRYALRVTPRGPVGIDVDITGNDVVVSAAGARDPFDVELDEDNRQRFLTLRNRLLDALTTHSGVRRKVLSATLDDAPLVAADDLGTVVKRIIDAAAPIVKQIRAHSLSPNELVIRRLLDDSSRVEIFVSTSELLEKLGRLPRPLRALFAPLGLEWQRARTPLPGEIYVEPPREAAERPVDEPDESPAHEAPRGEPAPVESARVDPAPAVEENPIAAKPRDDRPAPTSIDAALERMSAVEPPDETVVVTPPAAAPLDGISIDASDRQALAATVKRIVGVARTGSTQLAFQAYAALFEDDDFAKQRPQDQRQVLKLMVMAKSVPPATKPVIHAYQTALARLQALADDTNDPADQEMIGVCERVLTTLFEQ